MTKKWSFPPSVKKLCYHHNAFIVGSAADPKIERPRDIDVVVPFSSWNVACGVIPNSAVKNSYGGWSFRDTGQVVEVWPDDLNHYLLSSNVKYIWQPRFDLRYKRDK